MLAATNADTIPTAIVIPLLIVARNCAQEYDGNETSLRERKQVPRNEDYAGTCPKSVKRPFADALYFHTPALTYWRHSSPGAGRRVARRLLNAEHGKINSCSGRRLRRSAC